MTQPGAPARILRIDLTSRATRVEELDADAVRQLAGGSLLGAYLLMRETPPRLDPLDPRAPLVFASSAIAGRAGPGLARFSVVAKSPLSGGIGESRVEGPFGPALAATGFLGIVIEGAAGSPMYALVDDGAARVLPAEDLWGLDTSAVVDRLLARHGASRVAAIGPAGESLVRFASIVTDRSFAAARLGLGAVMGSKRLKAVVLAGGSQPEPVDAAGLAGIARAYQRDIATNPLSRWQHDPPGFGAWLGGAREGTFAVQNYRTSAWPDREPFASTRFLGLMAWGRDGCPDCPSDCIKGFSESPDLEARRAVARADGGDLHQEAACALGPNLGIDDLPAVIRLNERCLRLGMDPVSLGFTLSFAMEAREAGLIDGADLDGSDLRFGHAEAVAALVEHVARREGFGVRIAEGSSRLAAALPPAATRLALHVKGVEVAPFEPRTSTSIALGYAVSPVGPRYDFVEHDADYDDREPAWPHVLESSSELGITHGFPMAEWSPAKLEAFDVLTNLWSALDVLLVCPFASAPTRPLALATIARLMQAITGWDTDPVELLAWGARRLQLLRLYNVREGITVADDTLPARFFDEAIDVGPFAGTRLDRTAFEASIGWYYRAMGWDLSGVPTRETLARHGLAWAAVGAR